MAPRQVRFDRRADDSQFRRARLSFRRPRRTRSGEASGGDAARNTRHRHRIAENNRFRLGRRAAEPVRRQPQRPGARRGGGGRAGGRGLHFRSALVARSARRSRRTRPRASRHIDLGRGCLRGGLQDAEDESRGVPALSMKVLFLFPPLPSSFPLDGYSIQANWPNWLGWSIHRGEKMNISAVRGKFYEIFTSKETGSNLNNKSNI